MLVCLLAGLFAGAVVTRLSEILPSSRPDKVLNGAPGLGGRLIRYVLVAAANVLLLCLMTELPGQGEALSQLLRLVWIPVFVLIAVIDIEHRRVLPTVLLPAALLAILESLTTDQFLPALSGSIVGTLLGGFMFLGGQLYRRALHKWRDIQLREVPFGGGDVMLAGLCGLVVGWPLILPTLLLAVFGAGIAALLLLATGRVKFRSALPYAPFLLCSTVLVMRFQEVFAQLLRA